MDKISWNQIVTCLRELSDKDFQNKVWVRGEGNEISSPSELISQLFDDSLLGDLLETYTGETVISTELDSLLVELSQLIDRIDLRTEASVLTSSKQWEKVVFLAKKALELMLSIESENNKKE